MIKKLTTSILVRGLKNQVITIDEYVNLISYIDNKIDNKSNIAYFITKVYLINNLKVNIFFENDTMTT